jgi:hypothetical protein
VNVVGVGGCFCWREWGDGGLFNLVVFFDGVIFYVFFDVDRDYYYKVVFCICLYMGFDGVWLIGLMDCSYVNFN